MTDQDIKKMTEQPFELRLRKVNGGSVELTATGLQTSMSWGIITMMEQSSAFREIVLAACETFKKVNP